MSRQEHRSVRARWRARWVSSFSSHHPQCDGGSGARLADLASYFRHRMPTDRGLRLYVDGLLERGNLGRDEQEIIEGQCAASGRSVTQVLEEATRLLSDLSRCAGLVMAPKQDEAPKHIEFVPLGPGRALVVLVTESGNVENRIIDVPMGLPPSSSR